LGRDISNTNNNSSHKKSLTKKEIARITYVILQKRKAKKIKESLPEYKISVFVPIKHDYHK